jgi:uncharacterized membrane protein
MIMKYITGLLLGCLLALGATAAGAYSVAGSWTMNAEKSTFTGPSFKSQTRTYVVAADGTVTMSFTAVTADGSSVTGGATLKTDGKDHPITGSNDYDTTALRKVNGSTVTFKLKKAGKAVGHGTRIISAHGKVLTLTSTVTGADGKPYTSKMVFDKQ